MAPLSTFSAFGAKSMLKILTDKRALNNAQEHPHEIRSDEQATILQILALTFSAFSVASSGLAFYWFMKMRRSFRHDLIMLLIQSDMFKALWFMIYPIVTFLNGRPASHSYFCQVNGFFLAVGIEASDFSVLMIAIHSALYIFRPNNSGGEGGLYPYRRYAYGIYLFLPLLLAGLAFVNPSDAYVSDGTYCYLPVRPFWFRLTLSWIPRYLIFIIILVVYASIYFYVGYKFAGFTDQTPNASAGETAETSQDSGLSPQPLLPTTPPLAYHGLVPLSRQESPKEVEVRKPSRPELPRRGSFVRRGSVHQFMIMASFTSRVQPQIPTPPSELSVVDSDSLIRPSTPQPLPRFAGASSLPPRSEHSVEPADPSGPRNTPWRDNFVTRLSLEHSENQTTKPSDVDMFTALQRDPNTANSSPLSQLYLTNSRGDNLADLELLRTRDKIRRQLRFLFIYPLVYIGMWIVPFASHVFQYNDKYAHDPPFGLSCVTTVCVAMQAAVDCWLFSTREKPWRHIPDTNGGFWESLKFWTGWHGVTKRRIVRGPGRTREEMVKEARSAYRRRDEELAQRRDAAEAGAAAAKAKGPEGSRSPKMKAERSWWDHDGSAVEVEEGDGGDTSAVSERSESLEMRRKSRRSLRHSGGQHSREEMHDLGLDSEVTTLRNSYTTRSREMREDEVARIEEEITKSEEEACESIPDSRK